MQSPAFLLRGGFPLLLGLAVLLPTPALSAYCQSNASKVESAFLLDRNNNRIRMVSPIDVTVSTLAGVGTSRTTDGYGTAASLQYLKSSWLSRNNDYLYVTQSNCVRSVYLRDGFNEVKTIVGVCNVGGDALGSVSVARLGNLVRVISDEGDNGLFIADYFNQKIKYFDFTTKNTSVIAGNGGQTCTQSGTALSFQIKYPASMHIPIKRNRDSLLFASGSHGAIFMLNFSTSMVSTFAGSCTSSPTPIDGIGTNARFYLITSMVSTSDGSKIYVTDNAVSTPYNKVRVITYPGAVVSSLVFSCSSTYINFISFSAGNVVLYSTGDSNYYSKLNLNTSVCTKYISANTSGYLDGNITVAQFSTYISAISVGYIYNFSSCTQCGNNQYQNSSVLHSLSCLPCQTGKYSLGQSSTCFDCATAPANSYGSLACRNCATGKYAVMYATNCVDCSAGTYMSQTASTACVLCEPGSYSSDVGASVCQSCAPGKYASSAGSTACDDCPAGTYGSAEGAVSQSGCLACPAGQFCASSGTVAPQNCTAGNYSDSGASACTQCGAGLVSQDGAAYCTAPPACSAGLYGLAPDCHPCPPNTISSPGRTATLLDCRCLPGFVCSYTKRINVVLTLHNITWEMTTVAGLSQSAVIDAIAQAAGVSRDMVIINSMFHAGSTGGRRLLGKLMGGAGLKMFITVSGAEGLDVSKAYELLGENLPVQAHIAWEHKHVLRVAREFFQ